MDKFDRTDMEIRKLEAFQRGKLRRRRGKHIDNLNVQDCSIVELTPDKGRYILLLKDRLGNHQKIGITPDEFERMVQEIINIGKQACRD